MVSLSGLSVKLSAKTAQFRAGMSRAQDAAEETAVDLRRMGLAADSADRSLASAGRGATTTAIQFSGLSLASTVLTTRVFGLSAGLWGALIPAFAALSTALVPLVAAFGGFLTIGAAIGGIGLVGTLGALATNGEMLKTRFMEVVETFIDEFAPVIQTATAVLFSLMDAFEDIIPALVPAEDAIARIGGNFSQLGREIIQLLPALTDLATELALRFLPPFVSFAQRVLPSVPGLLRGLANAFADVLPILVGFGEWFAQIAPDLMDFGMNVLSGVADGLGTVGDAIANVLSTGAESDSLSEFLKKVITGGVEWLKNEGLPMVGDLAGDILDALSTYFETGGEGELTNVITSFMGGLADAFSNIKDKDIQRVTTQIKNILAGVMGALANALQSDEAGALGEEIARLTGAVFGIVFDELIKVASSEEFAQGVAQLSTAVASGLAKGIVIATGNALDNLKPDSFYESALAGAGASLGDQTRDAIKGGLVGAGARDFISSNSNQGSGETNVTVTVEGDTDVVRDVSAEVINEEQRATRRRQGRGTGPI